MAESESQDFRQGQERQESKRILKRNTEKHGRILVVDDDEWNCELLSQGLALEGHTCSVAMSGQDALDLIAQKPFELVLLDIAMPRMSGLEVLQILRRSYTLTELPVIIVTAREGSENLAEALGLGANDYVTKPVDMVVLMARVQTLLIASRLERRLSEEKRFTERVINSAHEMIISVNMNRRITLFNKAAEMVFGYTQEEILGQHVDLLYADTDVGMEVHQQSVKRNGYVGEIVNRRKNGEIFYSSLSVSILHDDEGRPIGVMGISTDITERKRLEQEKANLSRLKDEFLHIASHDLKNPVAAIYGLARVIQNFVPPGKSMTEECHDFVSQIVANAGVMERIIAAFLDFHALEDGKLVLTKESMDLNKVVEEVLEANTEYAGGKEIEMEFLPDDGLPKVSADPVRIQQAIQNLVGNAIKFCPQNAAITVRTQRRHDGLYLEVKDTGPGLTDEDLKQVFGKYTRLSNKPTGGETSSGLGLAICKQLIELHGGQIGAERGSEGGALFWFVLPMQ